MSRHRHEDHAPNPVPHAGADAAANPGKDAGTGAAEGTRGTKPKQRARKKPKVGKIIGETVLTLLAVFGFICAVLAIAAWTMNIGIILFKTGSMAPGIPAGSMAIVRTIPAEEAQVGDVITVERPNQMPITHRVTANNPDPDPASAPGTRIIEMKGDANPGPDPFPYRVTEVREVLWSKPGWGEYVVMISQPWTMVVIVLLASTIVTWAFWPRGEGEGDSGDGSATA